MIKKLEKLYKKSNAGKIVQWEIWTDKNVIYTEWGEVNGKLQKTFDTIELGKNIGKANATTPEQQAEAEAQSQWEKKLKKGYTKTRKGAEAGKLDKLIQGGRLPMLAPTNSYPASDDLFKHVTFPCYGQPKLDGMRCVAEINKGKVTLWSRERRPITSVPHIVSAIENGLTGAETIVLDGELYNHVYKDQFEELVSILRKDGPDPEGLYKTAQYHLYDVMEQDCIGGNITDLASPYTNRLAALNFWREGKSFKDPIQFIDTVVLNSREELDAFLELCIINGYEGCMVRSMNGPYESGKRSKYLRKCKLFFDAEFQIIGIEEGRGKLKGKVGKFICVTADGVEFGAPPKMSEKKKQELFENPKYWEGKIGTVTYLRVTNEGSLYLPRLKSIRDYE